jgi:hypothetical protein
MSHLRYGLVLSTALAFFFTAPVGSRAADENTIAPMTPPSSVRKPEERIRPPAPPYWSRAFPTPEESRAALFQPVPTQPSPGTQPGTGPAKNQPQDQQASGMQPNPATSGTGGAEKSAADMPGGNAAVPGNALAPWGPIGAVGQTIPAKFFARNDVLDRTPIMAFPLTVSDQERHRIFAAVMGDNTPAVAGAETLAPSGQLSTEQALKGMHPLPQSLSDIAQVQQLKYVRRKTRFCWCSRRRGS